MWSKRSYPGSGRYAKARKAMITASRSIHVVECDGPADVEAPVTRSIPVPTAPEFAVSPSLPVSRGPQERLFFLEVAGTSPNDGSNDRMIG